MVSTLSHLIPVGCALQGSVFIRGDIKGRLQWTCGVNASGGPASPSATPSRPHSLPYPLPLSGSLSQRAFLTPSLLSSLFFSSLSRLSSVPQ